MTTTVCSDAFAHDTNIPNKAELKLKNLKLEPDKSYNWKVLFIIIRPLLLNPFCILAGVATLHVGCQSIPQ